MPELPKNVEDIYGLTPLQQGMLFHSVYAPASEVYVTQFRLTFSGELDSASLRLAWQHAVDRHPVLRSLFLWAAADKPVQVVRRQAELPWLEEDWRGQAADLQAARLETFLAADRARSFDLASAPLMRVALIRTGEGAHHLVWTHHHILLDGWSVPLLLSEIFLEYANTRRGLPTEFPQRRPFQDYVRWLAEQDPTAGEAYWRAVLRGFRSPTPLLGDRAPGRPARTGDTYRQVRWVLSDTLTSELSHFAREQHLTLGSVLQGIWGLLLARYSGETDVCFGLTVSGRPPTLAGVEAMIGLFINGIPLRLTLSPEEPVVSWLQGLQKHTAGARQFEHCALNEIASWSEVPRGAPLFESLFVFENFPSFAQGGAPGIGLVGADVRSWTNYPLSLVAIPDTRLVLQLKFNTRRFGAGNPWSERILAHFEGALSSLIGRSTARLRDLELEPAKAFPAPALPDPWPGAVQDRVRARAVENPQRTAVEDDLATLSYLELDRSSTEVGQALVQVGVGVGDVVAVYAQRGAALVPALLGIWKAGAAFQILDQAYPGRRLAEQCRAVRPMALIRLTAAGALPDELRSVLSGLRGEWEIAARGAQVTLSPPAEGTGVLPPIQPRQLAYVTFTSATTGLPKAIAGTHAPLSHFFSWQTRRFGLDGEDRLSVLSGLAHDPLLRDIFSGLWAGARVCLPDPRRVLEAGRLAEWLAEAGITVAHLTPAVCSLLSPGQTALPRLRYAFFGADLLSPAHVARLKLVAPQARCVNFYGATETPQAAAYYEIPELGEPWAADGWAAPGRIPIGRGVDGKQVLVLVGGERLAAGGEMGELFVRTPLLSEGYLNDPQGNRERFLRGRFGGSDEDRLYRTGDLGRLLPDGNIEFCRRSDDQIKARGFRIEPAEVETALAAHPGVSAAVVLALPDPAGESYLAAGVVLVAESGIDPGELSSFAARTLPPHMVPRRIISIDSLPLTPNGKLDRRALAAALQAVPAFSAAPPRNETEAVLCRIWSEVLLGGPAERSESSGGEQMVGIHDSFFELGGHSISAMRLLARLREELKVELPLRSIFDNPTVAGMAQSLRREPDTEHYCYLPRESSYVSLVSMQPNGTRRPLFLVAGAHADEDQFLRYLSNLIPNLGLDQPVYGFKPAGLDGRSQAHVSVAEMAAEYVAELRRFQPEGPYLLGGECVGGIVAYEMAQILHEIGERVGLLVLMDTPRPSSGRALRSRRIMVSRRFWHLILHLRAVLRLPPFQGLRYLVAVARRKAGQLLASDPKQRVARRIRRVEVSYPRIMFRYRPKPYPGRLTLLVNERDQALNPDLGWGRLAAGGLDVRVVPGDHLTRLTVHGRKAARALRECLDEASATN